MSNYTEEQLKMGVRQEMINDTTLYYSMVKKEQLTLSFFTNDRLLVYDDKRRWLFYINDFKNTPFRNAIPDPKNNVYTLLNGAVFTNPAGTSLINVKFTTTNKEGQLESLEWNFSCETPQLCQ